MLLGQREGPSIVEQPSIDSHTLANSTVRVTGTDA